MLLITFNKKKTKTAITTTKNKIKLKDLQITLKKLNGVDNLELQKIKVTKKNWNKKWEKHFKIKSRIPMWVFIWK